MSRENMVDQLLPVGVIAPALFHNAPISALSFLKIMVTYREGCRHCDGQGAGLGFRIGVSQSGGGLDESPEARGIVCEENADYRATQGESVARREDSAAGRRKSEPEFSDGAEGRETDSSRQAEQPKA